MLFYPIENAKCQTKHHIIYESNFFWLYNKDGTYYDQGLCSFLLEIDILYDNNIENITFKLNLLSKEGSQYDYIVEISYYYYSIERAIYKNQDKVGIIPIFTAENLVNNQKIILAEFGNTNLTGTYVEESGNLIIDNKKIPYHYFLVDEANYTAYYYSDYENLLIFWEVGNSYEVTLDKLFGIREFWGHIKLKSTSYDINWEDINTSNGNFLPLIIIISIVGVGFLSIFILIRRTLIKKDRELKEKKYTHKHR